MDNATFLGCIILPLFFLAAAIYTLITAEPVKEIRIIPIQLKDIGSPDTDMIYECVRTSCSNITGGIYG